MDITFGAEILLLGICDTETLDKCIKVYAEKCSLPSLF